MPTDAQLFEHILSDPDLAVADKVAMVKRLLNSAARLRAESAPRPQRHHIDKRADALAEAEGDEDDLLDTREMSAWFGVSTQRLEIGRIRGYGPPYKTISPKRTRYRRGDVRPWLRERTHRSTSEYATT